MRVFILLVLACACTAQQQQQQQQQPQTLPKFKVIRQWKYANFTWPDPLTYQRADDEGLYIPQNIVLGGLKHHKDHYYITLPRMKDGVPATLTRIPAGPTEDTAPLLEPYPSWGMNVQGNCSALQNVQNVEIDPSGLLWIIDGGRVETFNRNPLVKCPPKLVIYDTVNDKLKSSYEFPEDVASLNGSFLYDLALDLEDGGYAYITDNGGKDPGLIVYSMQKNRSWKIRHTPSMRADPNLSSFTVNNSTLNARINVAGIAITPRVETRDNKVTLNEQREVYYSPLSSLHLYSLSSNVLRDERSANNGNEYQGPVTDYGLKPSPAVGMIMDNSGTMYYGLLTSSTIVRWDTRTPFTNNQKSIARDARFLDWVNAFTIEENGNLTVLVNKLEKFITAGLNIDEPNFLLVSAFIGTKSYLSDESFAYQASSTTSTTMSSTTNMAHLNDTHHHDDSGSSGLGSALWLVSGALLMLVLRH